MKKRILLVLGMLLFFIGCEKKNISVINCNTDIYLNTQEDLDEFNCEVVKGNLYVGTKNLNPLVIQKNHFKNLTRVERSMSLSNIEEIEDNSFSSLTKTGGLSINYNNLETINGFSSLTEIGSLFIQNNNNLETINGFSNITEIGGDLYISGNNNLETINGFSSLTEIRGGLYISDNNNLETINGFSNITEIGGQLYIINNNNLSCEELCVFYGKAKSYYFYDNLCNSYEELKDTCE